VRGLYDVGTVASWGKTCC